MSHHRRANGVGQSEKSITPETSFLGDTKTARLIASYDWSKMGIGSIADWPHTLCTTVSILLHSPVPMVLLWGKDGVMIYNDAYSLFAGAKHPQLLGSKVIEGWPEVADFNRNVMRVGFSGQTLSYKDQELTLYRNNQPEQVWMDLHYSPVYGEGNEPAGVLAIVTETTERVYAQRRQKQAEKALKDEQLQLQSLLKRAPAAIAVMEGPEHRYTLANELYKKVFSRTENQIIGKTLKEVLPEVSDQGIYEVFDAVYKVGEPFVANEFPITFQKKGNGPPTSGYFGFVVQPVKNLSKEVTGILVHAVETTAQVEARKRVEESEERFRIVSENATTGLLIMNNKQECTFMNPAAEKITGYTFKEVLHSHKPLHDIIHHSKPGGGRYLLKDCPIDRALPERDKMSGEDWFVRPDGSFYPVSYMASPITKDGQPIGTIIEIRDITEQKNAEDELRELIAITEQRNALLKINKAKDEFIGLASHQLRTPATTVKQYLAILMESYVGPLSVEQSKYLTIAYESNERQLAIINDLLKTAQINSGKYSIYKKPHDIARIIEKCISDLQSAFALRNQEVIFKKPLKIAEVSLDETEMKLVFMNLLENASKYSYPHSEIVVTLKAYDDHVSIKVTDRGVGISKDDQERIFDKFTRADNELSDTVTGTGLGLFWVKQIVEIHNGTVKLDSSPRQGTTFTVRLPR